VVVEIPTERNEILHLGFVPAGEARDPLADPLELVDGLQDGELVAGGQPRQMPAQCRLVGGD